MGPEGWGLGRLADWVLFTAPALVADPALGVLDVAVVPDVAARAGAARSPAARDVDGLPFAFVLSAASVPSTLPGGGGFLAAGRGGRLVGARRWLAINLLPDSFPLMVPVPPLASPSPSDRHAGAWSVSSCSLSPVAPAAHA
ncbi:MAG: hypothetical protein M3083_18655 [Actinomycetota bacterium]|nr:hypothetical protein [Actinomycetota bacterium]